VLASLSSVFHSTAFTVARDVALFCAVLFWLGCGYWTRRDARRRIRGPLLVWTATLLGFVPLVGPLAYLLFRPPETLEDLRARRAELQALELRLDRQEPECPVCRTRVDAGFLVCPVCTAHLKEPCRACRAPLDPLWQICPYCTATIGAPAPLDLDEALSAQIAAAGSQKARSERPRRAAAS
jgi:hypothetical protein